MDTRNVIAAISLSAAVIILYSLFFQPDPATVKQNLAEQKKIENNTDTPSLDKNEDFSKLSRADALKENDRIQFENGKCIFSLTFKYKILADNCERFKQPLSLKLHKQILLLSFFVCLPTN